MLLILLLVGAVAVRQYGTKSSFRGGLGGWGGGLGWGGSAASAVGAAASAVGGASAVGVVFVNGVILVVVPLGGNATPRSP